MPAYGVVRVYGKAIATDLKSYGPVGRYKWRAPLKFLNYEGACAWTRGYFDGDGDVRVTEKLGECMVRARSVNRRGLLDVKLILHKFFQIEAGLYRHGTPKFENWSQ